MFNESNNQIFRSSINDCPSVLLRSDHGQVYPNPQGQERSEQLRFLGWIKKLHK